MSERTTWEACTVRDVIERHFCGPSPDCEERQIFAPEEWGVLKTTAITWAGWNDAAHKVLPKAFWEQSQIEVHEGDVLVTKAGPRHRVGVVCHVPSTHSRLVVSGKMIGLRPKTEVVDARFLAGFLGTKEPQKYIHDRTTGMAESQVNFANEVLLDAPLRLPPVHEQHLIARVLDTLDTAIRETEALIG
ncbi:restriction endonuclease subunit S, partial [Pseudomonas profundi]